MDEVLKWLSGAPAGRLSQWMKLFIPVGSSPHPRSGMEMSPPAASVIKASAAGTVPKPGLTFTEAVCSSGPGDEPVDTPRKCSGETAQHGFYCLVFVPQ